MKITEHNLLRLGFLENNGSYSKPLEPALTAPGLMLNWDADTGLWLTDTLDSENHLFLNLTHVATLAQLTRLYWLLTGRHLLYHLKPFELSSVRLKSLPPINGSQKIRFNRPNDNR